MLVFGLIMTIQGFCQNATNSLELDTTITDSTEVICVPKFIMVKVIGDLKDYDYVKEELTIMTDQYNLQNEYIQQNDTLVSSMKKQIINYRNMLQNVSDQTDTYKLQLDKVARENEKRKGWIKGLAIGLITSFTINMLLIKN